MLIVAGTIAFDPTKQAAADAAFEKMRAATLGEPGCIEYQAYRDRSQPGVVFMFEQWQSQDALSAHFATAHMAEFGKAIGALGVMRMDVSKYEVTAQGSVP